MSNYSRVINLQCPTCGCIDFFIDEENSDVIQATCESCDRTFSKEELIQCNSENIEAHVTEVKEDIIDEFTQTFKSIFK